MANAIAGWYVASVPQHEADIRSAAFYGLVLAAGRWKDGAGASFSTFATYRIRGAIRDALRELLPRGYRRTPDLAPSIDPIETPEDIVAEYGRAETGGPAACESVIDDVALPVGWEAESADEVERLSRCLPPVHGAALQLVYLHGAGATLKAAGSVMQLSESRMSQLVTQAVEMLRERFRDRGMDEEVT
jgi:RNA polymerase sigma factor (sigma-70 family)